jgi:hypothetical protein
VLAVWCVHAGGVIVLMGAVSILRPLGFLRITSRKRGAMAMVLGVGLALIGFELPAPEHRVSSVATELDRLVPRFQFDEVHRVHVDAAPDHVFNAAKR